MKCAISLLLAVFEAGCMTEMGGPAGGDVGCADRHGIYRHHIVQTDGTCGPIPDLALDADAPVGANCAYEVATTGSNCHEVGTLTCDLGDGVTSVKTSTVTFSADGNHGTGTVFIRLSGASFCASTYTITMTAIR